MRLQAREDGLDLRLARLAVRRARILRLRLRLLRRCFIIASVKRRSCRNELARLSASATTTATRVSASLLLLLLRRRELLRTGLLRLLRLLLRLLRKKGKR